MLRGMRALVSRLLRVLSAAICVIRTQNRVLGRRSREARGSDIGWQRGTRRCNVCVFGPGQSMNRTPYNWTHPLGIVETRAGASASNVGRARLVTWAVLAAAVCVAAVSGTAHAQVHADAKLNANSPTPASSTPAASSKDALPSAVLLSTAGTRATIGPLDSVIQAALEKLAVVKVTARPGMDLNAVQLAIDCVSETPQCLRAVANQTQAQILLAPSLQSTQSELVLSLLRFDASDGRMRRVLRRQPGSSLKSETLDAVPSMLRELFNIPEPEPQPAPVAADTSSKEPAGTTLPPIVEPPQDPAPSRPLPLGPFLLAGGGALVLGGGAIAGAIMLNTQDKYNTHPVKTERDVTTVNDLKDEAKTQAVIANVLYGVGGAMMVAGGVWLAVSLSQPARRDAWQTAVIPAVGPGQLGVAIVHRGGAF